jgi:hypothetical protein
LYFVQKGYSYVGYGKIELDIETAYIAGHREISGFGVEGKTLVYVVFTAGLSNWYIYK